MKLTELKTRLKTKDIPNLLIFTGDEIQVQKIYRNKISEVLGLPLVRCETVNEVYDKITKSSFLTGNCIYFVFDDIEFISIENGIQSILNHIGNNYLILQYSKLDKRSKFYKNNESVEFEKLSADMLIKYIQKDWTINVNIIKQLIEVCNQDYSRILLELDKISNYSKSTGKTLDESATILLTDGTIYIPPYDAIFDWVDAVLRKQWNRADKLLKISYSIGEATLTLLSGLYINVKHVLQVQSCQNQDIAGTTGLTPFQIKCVKEKIGYYSIKELVDLLKKITEVEEGIKMGTIEDAFAINYLISII